MKENITSEQWQELGKTERRKLEDFFERKHVYDGKGNMSLTVVNMMEFLGEKNIKIYSDIVQWGGMGKFCWKVKPFDLNDYFEATELCDALWLAVKNKLIR